MIPEQEQYYFNLFNLAIQKLVLTSKPNMKGLENFRQKYQEILFLFRNEEFDILHIKMEELIDALQEKKAS